MSDENFVKIICPKCQHQQNKIAKSPYLNPANCEKCSEVFDFLYGIVRSKKSRGNKTNIRGFDVRVYLLNDEEKLIQFVRDENEDIELRSKDHVLFIYSNDEVHALINTNIGQYSMIKNESLIKTINDLGVLGWGFILIFALLILSSLLQL